MRRLYGVAPAGARPPERLRTHSLRGNGFWDFIGLWIGIQTSSVEITIDYGIFEWRGCEAARLTDSTARSSGPA